MTVRSGISREGCMRMWRRRSGTAAASAFCSGLIARCRCSHRSGRCCRDMREEARALRTLCQRDKRLRVLLGRDVAARIMKPAFVTFRATCPRPSSMPVNAALPTVDRTQSAGSLAPAVTSVNECSHVSPRNISTSPLRQRSSRHLHFAVAPARPGLAWPQPPSLPP